MTITKSLIIAACLPFFVLGVIWGTATIGFSMGAYLMKRRVKRMWDTEGDGEHD